MACKNLLQNDAKQDTFKIYNVEPEVYVYRNNKFIYNHVLCNVPFPGDCITLLNICSHPDVDFLALVLFYSDHCPDLMC